MWLDFLIFGSGRGLSAPALDQSFYWLVDSHKGHGRIYTWIGGLGAQLTCFQWRHPRAGETRYLCGRNFTPFHSERCWGRVRCAWATNLPDDLDKAHAILRDMETKLGRWQP